MLNEILKLKGVNQLNKKQLSSIKGSLGAVAILQDACHTVTCDFSDGLGWEINTNDSGTANGFEDTCKAQGGTAKQTINCM